MRIWASDPVGGRDDRIRYLIYRLRTRYRQRLADVADVADVAEMGDEVFRLS